MSSSSSLLLLMLLSSSSLLMLLLLLPPPPSSSSSMFLLLLSSSLSSASSLLLLCCCCCRRRRLRRRRCCCCCCCCCCCWFFSLIQFFPWHYHQGNLWYDDSMHTEACMLSHTHSPPIFRICFTRSMLMLSSPFLLNISNERFEETFPSKMHALDRLPYISFAYNHDINPWISSAVTLHTTVCLQRAFVHFVWISQ